MQELPFFLNHIVLLGAEDAAWSGDADPPDEVGGWELEVLHSVAANQSAGTAQPRLAVDSYDTWLTLGHIHETAENVLRRSAPIEEEQISMLDAATNKALTIILGFVKAHNMSNAKVFENLQIIFRTVATALIFVVDGPHEGDKLARNDPIEVAIFDLFVVLILFGIESL